MKIGRVVGTVVATRKSPKLEGTKLLLIEECGVDGKPKGSFVVAADTVQAGAGETVLFVSGSSARMAYPREGTPIDAAVSAVIDAIEYGGEVRKPNAL
ncbi:MAG: ethanolamine utilization protein EutN [Candidatus Hydrogenedentota bacterium]|nr:MAG: ethanolamine utilization protein EutN [Candidatus Hydrogenedentota bacterium]